MSNELANGKRRAVRALGWLMLAAGGLSTAVPFLWMLVTALKPASSVLTIPPRIAPNEFTLENFRQVATAFPLVTFFGNSVGVAAVTVASQVLTGAMAAYAFARLTFRGREALFMVYLATLMVPAQVLMTPLFIMMRWLGWQDTYLGLVAPGLVSVFGTFLLRQSFLTIPRALEEAAFIDGASHWRVFWQIIMPLSKPAVATFVVFAFMSSWNSFLWPLIIVGSEQHMTLPLGLTMFQGRWMTQWNMLMAGTLISVLPIVAVYLAAQNQFIKGLTLTGIKG